MSILTEGFRSYRKCDKCGALSEPLCESPMVANAKTGEVYPKAHGPAPGGKWGNEYVKVAGVTVEQDLCPECSTIMEDSRDG